ncbi:MAG: glycosyltransferase family 2 protein [Clostridia bacterium]|nr:glycosyltransferase family 2 protein [Clostridia bacterium]
MSNNIKLTIFTPAYNRAHTLPRTYESLCNQTNKNFIWMIIDDGSTDNTKELVSKWQSNDNRFEIQYFYKKNGGMHTAHNVAYKNITTELNVCIDSDDMMPVDAVDKILTFWDKNGSDAVAGIVALDADMSGRILGTQLPKEIKQTTTTKLYGKFGVTGDKKFIYRTEVINSVPAYPEFEGEKLVPLGYKYNLVAQKYEMLLMNDVVCLVDYQADGSTNTILKQYLQSPRGFAASNAVAMQSSESYIDRLKSVVHYIAECRIAGDKNWFKNSPRKFVTLLLYPLGFAAEKYIRYVNRRSK